jgi:DNA-binding transcriptional LysR family regulator
VRIGAFPSAVRTLLAPALVALGRDHPALELRVSELDPVAMPGALRMRSLDVALLHDYDITPAGPDPTLDSIPLLDEAVFLAVPDGRQAELASDPIAGARHCDWIVASPGTLCHSVALRICQAAGFGPRVRHHADDFVAVLALVAAGQGVALVPQLAAAQPPPGVRLLPLPASRRTRLAYRRGAGAHPAIAACAEALRRSTAAYLRHDPAAGHDGGRRQAGPGG